MDVYIESRRVRLDPSRAIGKGGEADVFDVGGGRALKLFKAPDHPDLDGLPDEQRAAEERLREHQRKLPAFPTGLPPRVVVPDALATDRRGSTIHGYRMRLLDGAELLARFADPAARSAIPDARVVAVLRDLHASVAGLHRRGVVIGDFNDLNVLVRGDEAHLIDADSFQFGPFACRVFTERFVDPRLCALASPGIMLRRPFDTDSDWYAFAVMLMQSLLFVGPYGGIHKPKGKPKLTPHE
ncbi:MAG: hypothetical protein ACK4N5_23100, partial [Myxococcales bacterium]